MSLIKEFHYHAILKFLDIELLGDHYLQSHFYMF